MFVNFVITGFRIAKTIFLLKKQSNQGQGTFGGHGGFGDYSNQSRSEQGQNSTNRNQNSQGNQVFEAEYRVVKPSEGAKSSDHADLKDT